MRSKTSRRQTRRMRRGTSVATTKPEFDVTAHFEGCVRQRRPVQVQIDVVETDLMIIDPVEMDLVIVERGASAPGETRPILSLLIDDKRQIVGHIVYDVTRGRHGER